MHRTNLLSFNDNKSQSSVAGAGKKADASNEDTVKVHTPEEDYLKLHLCHYNSHTMTMRVGIE